MFSAFGLSGASRRANQMFDGACLKNGESSVWIEPWTWRFTSVFKKRGDTGRGMQQRLKDELWGRENKETVEVRVGVAMAEKKQVFGVREPKSDMLGQTWWGKKGALHTQSSPSYSLLPPILCVLLPSCVTVGLSDMFHLFHTASSHPPPLPPGSLSKIFC